MSDGDPYRTGPIVRVEERHLAVIPKPSSRWFLVRATAWTIFSVSIVVAMQSVGGAFLFMASMGFGWIVESVHGMRWFWRAKMIVESMPFPVEHRPGGDYVPKSSGRGIRWVRFRLPPQVESKQLDAIAKGAHECWPSLFIEAESIPIGHELVLRNWPNLDDDIVVLATLLDTWGRELHREHHVQLMIVSWHAIAPAPPGEDY